MWLPVHRRCEVLAFPLTLSSLPESFPLVAKVVAFFSYLSLLDGFLNS